MNTIFKSALNQIKSEEALVNKTEIYLKDSFSDNKKTKPVRLFQRKSVSKLFLAAASFLVIVIGGSSAAYAYYQTPVAYLSLDINPSVELGVNAFGKVVTAEGYNEDGQAVLADTDVTGSTVEDAIQNLILSASDKGYIADDGSTVISLTSETSNTDKATSLQTKSESGVKQALEKVEKQAIVQKENVALERRDEAKQLGITPGKLNLINKLQDVDTTASIDDYKDASVKEIMNKIKLNKDIDKSNSETDNINDSIEDNQKNTTVNSSTKYETEQTKKSNDDNKDNANVTKSQTISEKTTKKTAEKTDSDSDINHKNNVEISSKVSSEGNTKVDSGNTTSPTKANTSATNYNSENNSKSNHTDN